MTGSKPKVMYKPLSAVIHNECYAVYLIGCFVRECQKFFLSVSEFRPLKKGGGSGKSAN